MENGISKSCSLFLNSVNDYLDGELDQTRANAMKEHMDSCCECRAVYEECRAMLKDLADLDADAKMPLECQAAWRREIRKEAKHVYGKKTLKRFLRAAGAVAAAAVVILGVSRFIPQTQTVFGQANEAYVTGESYDSDGGVYMAYSTPRSASKGMILQSDGEYDQSNIVNTSAQTVQPSVVIKNATRKIETQDFDRCVKSISDIVEEYQGYFEQSTVEGQPLEQGNTDGRVANMRARVPSTDLDAFLSSVDAVGTVTYSRVTADDISEDYYDAKSRLQSLRTQLDRLNELVTTAADLEQLLLLEEKIADTQYSIDSMEGTIAAWDSKAGYSTVNMTVTEIARRDRVVAASQSLSERIKIAFYDGVNWLGQLGQSIVVALALAAPVLMILIPVAVIIIIISSIIKKKKR